jgi:hypothetical protein
MDGVQCGLATVFWDDGRSGFDDGQENLGQTAFRQTRFRQWLGCRNLELINLTPDGKSGKSKAGLRS